MGTRRCSAVFADEGSLRPALEKLVKAGLTARDLEIRSLAPLHGLKELPGVRVRSRVLWIAVAGGLLGGLFAYGVALYAGLSYPIVTGGMPLVAPMPTGIVTYELTALGTILATVAGVLFEARLLRPGGPGTSPHDAQVPAGRIVLGVHCPDGTRGVDEALAGALDVVDLDAPRSASFPPAPSWNSAALVPPKKIEGRRQ